MFSSSLKSNQVTFEYSTTETNDVTEPAGNNPTKNAFHCIFHMTQDW